MEFLFGVGGMEKSGSAVDARVQSVASIGSMAAGDEQPVPEQRPRSFVNDREIHFTVFAAAHS